LFAVDRSGGTEEVRAPSAGRLVLTCTLETCRYRADYTTAAVARFQKEPVKPNETRTNSESKSRKRKHWAQGMVWKLLHSNRAERRTNQYREQDLSQALLFETQHQTEKLILIDGLAWKLYMDMGNIALSISELEVWFGWAT
jgi:hypothetical protein